MTDTFFPAASSSQEITKLTQSMLDTYLQLWCMPDIGPKTIELLLPYMLQGWKIGQTLEIRLPQKQQRSLLLASNRKQAEVIVEKVHQWCLQPNHHLLVNLPGRLNSTFEMYPRLLAQIYSPPPVLMVQGDVACLQGVCIGMVGSRNPSSEGVMNARAFSQYLVEQGVVVVSGGAAGIDRAAHEAALACKGQTVAVLGHGLDFCYPAAHRSLFKSIAAQGALVSEFPLGTGPKPALFPRRNRIITGLSYGVCVVEAGLPSGSLVSAKWSYEQNREVFAIPGSIHNPRAKGCHSLIQQGAKLVQSGEDIMNELVHQIDFDSVQQDRNSDAKCHGVMRKEAELLDAKPTAGFEQLSLEQQIVHVLTASPASLDDLSVRFNNVSVQDLAMVLSELEIDGVIGRDVGSGLLIV